MATALHTEGTMTEQTNLLINGEWRTSSDSGTYDAINPARPSEVLGTVAAGTATDVDAAYGAARAAAPGWAALTYQERAAYLERVVEVLTADQADVDHRIALLTAENGKVLREATLEISRLGDRFTQVAAFADRLSEDEAFAGPPFDTIVTRAPYGVALLITPWNWPLAILGSKLPHALMAGNTVVIKPSEYAALSTALTIKLIADVLPPGVVNMVTGDGVTIGDALTTHAEVDKISYTGSGPIGQHIMRMAAGRLTPLTLELGGNDAGVMLADADITPETFLKLHMSGFITSGQVCMAMKRLYVHASRFDEVVDGLRAFEDNQVVGDGSLPDTTMGPIIHQKQHNHVKGLVADARGQGADVVELGSVPDQALFDAGYFVRPTLVVDADNDLSIVQQEQFGPVMPIVKFSTDEEAVALANSAEYGLASSVWSADADHALAIARRLEAGTTYLNAHGPTSQDARAPFGGWKMSGFGVVHGFEGVRGFQRHHTITSPAGTLF